MKQAIQSEPVLWKTLFATVMSLVITAVVSSVLAIILGLTHFVYDGIDWFTDIWGQILGGAMGVYAACSACDRFVRPYSGHVVFIILVIIMMASVIFEDYYFPKSTWLMITHAGNAIAITVVAYLMFWRGERIHNYA